ncbi:phenylalanine 4-monooxygenase [Pseudoruegeria sp. HB172150]|uniref:phenylalanine 4-monooxygenase n=1 Tax=Pseudoruegeria sp. HB172150 TaxID=2721164 RepID=UPI0015570ABF|nr:phenylalanine 4-monooxygenase [Pseudoruegeria sp. HB172150]
MPKNTTYASKKPDASGHIQYTPEEDAVWRDLIAAQLPRVERYMARPYLEGLAALDLPRDRVPQCTELSETLRDLTGWRVEPVPALIPFGTFFGMLADRAFPAASFIRRREHFDYIEEPDIFHEIFGHAPLLTHPEFAAFSQAIGKAGLKARKEDHAWLIRLYWFTIEFGLMREDGRIKGLGSGLASSTAELEHATSNVPLKRDFDVVDILRTSYRIDIPQPVYYVISDLEELFAAAARDLLAEVAEARRLGVLPPLYPAKEDAA